jgi:hypothetical protein
MEIIVDVAKFHPRLRHENVQTYEALAYYPFGKFGEKCVIYITFGMAVSSDEVFLALTDEAHLCCKWSCMSFVNIAFG